MSTRPRMPEFNVQGVRVRYVQVPYSHREYRFICNDREAATAISSVVSKGKVLQIALVLAGVNACENLHRRFMAFTLAVEAYDKWLDDPQNGG